MSISLDQKPRRVSVILLHPIFVQIDFGSFYLQIYMKTIQVLIVCLTLIQLSLSATSAGFNCATATQAQCGYGICNKFQYSNGTCIMRSDSSGCQPGWQWSNSSSTCLDCSTLPTATCSSTCSAYYFGMAPSTNQGVTNGSNGNSTQACISCQITYGIDCTSCGQGVCASCKEKLVLNDDKSHCKDPTCGITQCAKCKNNATCFLCQPGFVAAQTGCVTATCKSLYCLTCQATLCKVCYDGYAVENGVCKPLCDDNLCTTCYAPGVCGQCVEGNYVNPATGLCQKDCTINPIPNCFQCSTDTICQTCLTGYKIALKGQKCQYICNLTNCQICDANSTVCTTCIQGYTKVNGTCTTDLCIIPNCDVCENSTTCKTCLTDYDISDDKMTCTPGCGKTEPDCWFCNGTQCVFCYLGYKLVPASTPKCQKICSITHCSFCLTSSMCLFCDDGFYPSKSLTSCLIECADSHCSICSSNATTCDTCQSGYSKDGNGVCIKNCKSGSVNTAATGSTPVCLKCNTNLPNCAQCTYAANVFTCVICEVGTYLATNGACVSCTSIHGKCLTCRNGVLCDNCKYPYLVNPDDGTCIKVDCNVDNCQRCVTGNAAMCKTCADGFIKNNGGASCTAPTCSAGLILMGTTCGCAAGAMISNGKCVACADKCVSCTAASGCTQCSQGYFNLKGVCKQCSENCKACKSASKCTQCASGYVLNNNDACIELGDGANSVSHNGKYIQCDPGCLLCLVGSGNLMICLIAEIGYIIDSNGAIGKCNKTCRTCSPNDPTFCLTCYDSNSIMGGQCVSCKDPNALSCLSTNANYSLTCVGGYSASATATLAGGYCSACAINCKRCDSAGPGSCDDGQCAVGYVMMAGSTECIACYNSCSVCDPNDLNICKDCGALRYIDAGSCYVCPTGCSTCTSASICGSCLKGYTMIGKLCQTNAVYPCATLDAAGVCNSCFFGYSQSGSSCTIDIATCNNDGSCIACPRKYYLSNHRCQTCPAIDNCQSCDSTDSTKCILCNKSYYLDGTCMKCPTGCKACSSDTFCLQAGTGYYISINLDGSSSGKFLQCTSPCATCKDNPNFCTSCESGYQISGTICKSTASTIAVDLTLGGGTRADSIFHDDDPEPQKLTKCMRSTGRIRKSMCKGMGFLAFLFGGCERRLRFRRFRWGSVIIDGDVDATGTDLATAQTSIQAGLAAGIDGATVLKVSTTSNAAVAQSSSNLGLILGVSIPLGILIILVIISIWKRNASMDKQTPDYEKNDGYQSAQHFNEEHGEIHMKTQKQVNDNV